MQSRPGCFTAVRANTVKAWIYENADRWRMAAYYAEKVIAAEAGHTVIKDWRKTATDLQILPKLLASYSKANPYIYKFVVEE
ncbi:MAG: hypothetical protein IJR07_02815 [Bacteroidaceae bacterium]|nr:hypothetical protein [Bacteroidaceae bacterium]